MKTALITLDEERDCLQVFGLCPIVPSAARAWLEQSGWPEKVLDAEVSMPLFEKNSYALRPFFLSELARAGVYQQIEEGYVADLLSFLISSMIEREAGKFGRDVEVATTVESRENFIKTLMEEVARDMAENQTDAIPSDTLAWLAEVVASEVVEPGITGILKNRAGVIAFLGDDDRRGYRKFVHEQIADYFLSYVTVRSISSGEIPKFVRRNIFGLEFLESFCSVIRHLDGDAVDLFVERALTQISSLGDYDRSRRNLAALILAAGSVSQLTTTSVLENLSLDEVYIAESASNVRFKSVTIAQMFAREADLRALNFDENCVIVSLIADDATIPSVRMPLPALIDLHDRTLSDPMSRQEWFVERLVATHPGPQPGDTRKILADFPLFNLLDRLARYKPFWLKDGEERGARRILDDVHWPILKELMLKHDLLIVRNDVPAAGRPSPFYHVKNRRNLLVSSEFNRALHPFFSDLFMEDARLKKITNNLN